jgi:hypothetical protein
MKPIVNAGIVLGVSVGIWIFINGFAGLYKSQGTAWVFPVIATVIEIFVIVWGLRKTAQLGRRYGGQVVAGLMIAVVGAVLILGFSLVSSTVFTDAGEFIAAMQADAWADAGMSEDQIEETLASTAFTRTPLFQAISGSIATIVTGLVVSLIAAIFIRQKEA